MNQQRLIHIFDSLLVHSLVVVSIDDFLHVSCLLVLSLEGVFRSLAEVNVCHSVGLLVVGCHHCLVQELFLDKVLILASHRLNSLKCRILSQHPERHIHIQHDSVFILTECRRKTRPDLNIMLLQRYSLLWVEVLPADLIQLQIIEHGIKKYFVEDKGVAV